MNESRQIIVLTDKGRRAAANLLTPWPPLKNYGIQDRIHEILKNLDEETHELIKRLKRPRPHSR
jgi:DNA-binding MarR family transcriptional regulator